MQRDIIYYCWNSIRRLGDASMPLQKVKPQLNLKFAQKRANADYIQHLYDLFKYFVGTPPRVQNKRSDYQSLRFQTYSHSELKFYDKLFYLDYKYKGYRRPERSSVKFLKILATY